jgi:hypothetical protein
MPAITNSDSIGVFAHKDNYVLTDKTTAPFQTAHPDSTLLMAGFARLSAHGSGADTRSFNLIGKTNSFQVADGKNVQPLKEFGSSRHIMTTSNMPVTIGLSEVVLNGPNLLRSLYSAAVNTGVVIGENFGLAEIDTILSNTGTRAFVNLDYPIFDVPFGLAIVGRSTTGDDVQGIYAEVCVIQSWSWASQTGQTAQFANVNIIADRILPVRLNATDSSNITKVLNTMASGSESGFSSDTAGA